MSPQTALWIILTIGIVTAAAMAPLTWEFRQELARAKKNMGNFGATALATSLLGFVSLGLWWYYATSTNQILLAIIPTVSVVWGWLVRATLAASKKAAR